MGNWVTLEALRGRSMRRVVRGGNDKVKQAFLVAPDVDVDVFRATIRRMGPNRPKMLLFVSQDDGALALSKEIWGGVPRIGEVDPAKEPYRTEFDRDRIAVYDLTQLKGTSGNAHSRAFDDITQVLAMVRDRNAQQGAQVARNQPATQQAEAVALRD
jgi:esterase/lipase superfamily enzyme